MAHETEHTSHHPSFNQYVLIAIILFAITIVEFMLIWDRAGIVDNLGPSKIPLLVFLSAIKFAIVIMFYMHLKFDNRLLGSIFVAGLLLAFLVGIALIGLFVGFGGGQRSYAELNAVPYVEHHEAEEETTTSATSETTETPPVAAGPVAIAIGAVGETLAFNTTSISADSGSEESIRKYFLRGIICRCRWRETKPIISWRLHGWPGGKPVSPWHPDWPPPSWSRTSAGL